MEPNHTYLLQWMGLHRPHGGKNETLLRTILQNRYGGQIEHGNLVVRVGASRTLFSSHLDTVHSKDAAHPPIVRDNVAYSGANEPLGADCTAGVWLMATMIERKIPGAYVFHVGEECGGVGSGLMADKAEWLCDMNHAVAFDRRGTGSVITHQMGRRCCSEVFATALADALNANGMNYRNDNTGIYTDTAFYTHLIPECTNVSVGYYNEHSPRESLDILHLTKLAVAVGEVMWDSLPVVRVAKPEYSEYAEWTV